MTAMNATIEALPETYTPTLADLRRADQTRRAIKAGQAPSLEDLRHLTAIRKGQAPTQPEPPNAMQDVLGFRPGTLDPSMSSQPADATTTYPDRVDPGTSTVAPGAIPTDLDALGGLARSPFVLAKQGAGLLVGAEQALAGPFAGQAVVGPALVRGISRAADQMAPAPQTFLGRAAEQTFPLAAGIAGGAALGGTTALGRTLASGAVAGAQSAGGTAAAAIDRGLSPEVAAKEAAVSGVTGAITGALPLGRFASRLAGGNPAGGLLGDLAAQGVAGTAQSLADAAAASWIEQNPEQWRQAVAGMGETAAMNLVLGLVGHGVTAGGTKPQQLPRSGEVLYGGATNEPPTPARQPAATEPITPAAVESANGQETQGRQEGLLRQPVPASPGETTPGAAGAMGAVGMKRGEAKAAVGSETAGTEPTPPGLPEPAGDGDAKSSASVARSGSEETAPSSPDTTRTAPASIETGNTPRSEPGQTPPSDVRDYSASPNDTGRVGPPPETVANPPGMPKGDSAISPRSTPNQDQVSPTPEPNQPGFLDSVIAKAEKRRAGRKAPKVEAVEKPEPAPPPKPSNLKTQNSDADQIFDRGHRLIKPIKGKTGAEIVAYRWMSTTEEGMFRDRKVSDWSQAQTSAPTGRSIVHVYLVKTPDGTETVMGVGAAKKSLGMTEDKLYAIAKREASNQRILAEQQDRNEKQILKNAATTVQDADANYRKTNDPAKMMWGTPEQHRDAAEKRFQKSSLLTKDGKFLRTGDQDTLFSLKSRGWVEYSQGSVDVSRVQNEPAPSRIEKAADATIAAAEARKAERRKALAEARSKAKKGDRLGASILPDIVDDVVIVAAKAVKAGARGAEAIRRMVREHFGSDNPDAEREITRILSASTTGDRYDNARFNTEIQKLYGRPDLANPATAPEARDFVDTVDALRNASGKPERRADVDVEKDATDRLAKDYEGEKKRLIEAATKGTTPTDVDTVIARKIVEDSALKAVREGSSSDYMEALTIANAYRDQGAEIARAFRQRRDKVMSPAEREAHAKSVLAQILTTPSPEIRQRLGRIRDQIAKAVAAGDEARANRFREAQTKTLQKAADTAADVKQKMKDMGVDPETITSQDLADPDTAARIARAQSTAQSSVWDMVHEYWVNSILSGPLTHVANIIGNTGYGAWDLGVNKLLSVATGKALGGKDTGTVGEWAETLKAFGPSLAEATRSFARTFATETPVFSEQARGYSDPSQPVGVKAEIQGSRATIPGKTGRVIRTPGRLLMATDEFFKTVYTKMVIHGEAYRAAVREGKSGAAARARAAELAQNPTAEMWGEAVKTAERLTFQDQSELASVLGDVKNALPGLRYVIPFIRTPLNIFKAGVGMTPLGLFSTVAKVARAGLVKMDWAPDTGWTYTRRDLASDLSKNLLSVGAAALLYGLMDDKDPRITGSAARETGKRAGQYRTAPPYSVRIGDSWYSYKRVEPFAVTLSSTVDLLDGYRNADDPEKKVAALAKAVQGIGKQGLDKTFLKGLGDMFGAIENQSGSGKEAVQYLSNFATGFVPNIIRQPMQAMDPTPRDMTVRPDEAGYIGPVLKNAARRAFPIGNLPPRMDVWGRVVENRPTGNVATDTLYRMLLPIQNMPANETLPVDRLLVNWNNKVEDNPDGVEKSWWPAAPTNLVTIEEKKYRLTEDEYVRYVKESGRQALENLSFSEDEIANPEPSTIRTIQSILRSTRRDVAEQIINDRKSK